MGRSFISKDGELGRDKRMIDRRNGARSLRYAFDRMHSGDEQRAPDRCNQSGLRGKAKSELRTAAL